MTHSAAERGSPCIDGRLTLVALKQQVERLTREEAQSEAKLLQEEVLPPSSLSLFTYFEHALLIMTVSHTCWHLEAKQGNDPTTHVAMELETTVLPNSAEVAAPLHADANGTQAFVSMDKALEHAAGEVTIVHVETEQVEMKNMHEEVERANDEATRANEEMKRMKGEVEHLKGEVEHLKGELEAAEKEMNNAKSHAESAQKKIEKATENEEKALQEAEEAKQAMIQAQDVAAQERKAAKKECALLKDENYQVSQALDHVTHQVSIQRFPVEPSFTVFISVLHLFACAQPQACTIEIIPSHMMGLLFPFQVKQAESTAELAKRQGEQAKADAEAVRIAALEHGEECTRLKAP